MSWSGCREVSDTICPVADKELVEHMVCDNRDEDCEPVNKRFKEKCERYKDCPPDPAPFICEQKQCVSKAMQGPEKVACCSLCLCLAVAVHLAR